MTTVVLYAAIILIGLASVTLVRLKKENSDLRRANAERRLFAALVEGSQDFIGVVGIDRRPRYLNQAGREMLGLRLDEPIEEFPLLDIYPPEERAAADAMIREADIHGTSTSESVLRNVKTGATVPVSQTRFAIHDPDTGAMIGWATITRDISATKQLHRSLRELSTELERAQTVAGVGSWRGDVGSDARVWSKESYRMLGIAPETPAASSLFFALIHPDDRAYVEARWKAAIAGAPYDVEYRIVVAGETRWMHSKAEFEVGADGKRVSTIGTVQDITEQKRLEAEQRLLADLSAALSESLEYERILGTLASELVRELADFCVVDIIEPNGTLVRIRVESRDRAKRWVCEILAREVVISGRTAIAAEAIATNRPTFMPEVSQPALIAMARSDEHLRALRGLDARSLIVVPLVAGGSVLGAIALVASRSSRAYGLRDLRFAEQLAHRAALSIENARLYTIAQDAIRSRDEVLGVVAHDLRNPLNAIRLSAEIVREQGQPPAQHSAAAIVRATRRMNDLIEDLLDLTRVQAGRLSITRQRVPAGDLVRDTVEAHAEAVAAGKLELAVDIPPDLPSVWADRDRLLQIFDNLVGNAIKFTDQGGHISLGAQGRGDEVLFWVADTGIGIAPEDQPQVFERFWQGHREQRRGAGLGLQIAKGIVEAHGGHIWLASKPGEGTTMFFTIPIAPLSSKAPSSIGAVY